MLGPCRPPRKRGLVHKLDTFTEENRVAQATVRAAIWQLYRDLKAYQCAPSQ